MIASHLRVPRAGRLRHGDCGSLAVERRLAAGAEGGGTTGPMSPSGASSRSTITGAWSLGPVPLRACRSTHAARTLSGHRVAGQHQVDPHAEVLVEHPGPVVPVGEHPLGRPAIAHDVVQAERLQVGQRLALGRRDVGLADVGGRVEHVGVGRRDVHVTAHDRVLRTGAEHLSQRGQPGELVAGSARSPGSRPFGTYTECTRIPPQVAATRPRLRMWEARARRRPRPPRRPAPPARGSPPRSTAPRRGGRPRSRGRASSSPSSSSNASSASLVSCRQTTSGWRSSSHGSSRGTRCLTELTFQVATRTSCVR